MKKNRTFVRKAIQIPADSLAEKKFYDTFAKSIKTVSKPSKVFILGIVTKKSISLFFNLIHSTFYENIKF
jgi:hypothetical protein